MTKNLALVTVVLVVLAASVASIVVSYSNSNKTCEVQARGLSAQPYLTKAMGEIAALLTPPPNQKIPPGQAKEYQTLGDLRSNLGSYVAIEGQQPKHRAC